MTKDHAEHPEHGHQKPEHDKAPEKAHEKPGHEHGQHEKPEHGQHDDPPPQIGVPASQQALQQDVHLPLPEGPAPEFVHPGTREYVGGFPSEASEAERELGEKGADPERHAPNEGRPAHNRDRDPREVDPQPDGGEGRRHRDHKPDPDDRFGEDDVESGLTRPFVHAGPDEAPVEAAPALIPAVEVVEPRKLTEGQVRGLGREALEAYMFGQRTRTDANGRLWDMRREEIVNLWNLKISVSLAGVLLDTVALPLDRLPSAEGEHQLLITVEALAERVHAAHAALYKDQQARERDREQADEAHERDLKAAAKAEVGAHKPDDLDKHTDALRRETAQAQAEVDNAGTAEKAWRDPHVAEAARPDDKPTPGAKLAEKPDEKPDTKKGR